VLPDPKALTVVAFLRPTVQSVARHAITVERVLTGNTSSYCSAIHGLACRTLGIGHLRTRAYRPSAERTAALDGWLWHYNHHRKHSALGHKPPIARLNERTNLLGTYT
jgi:transposase InsO family protein